MLTQKTDVGNYITTMEALDRELDTLSDSLNLATSLQSLHDYIGDQKTLTSEQLTVVEGHHAVLAELYNMPELIITQEDMSDLTRTVEIITNKQMVGMITGIKSFFIGLGEVLSKSLTIMRKGIRSYREISSRAAAYREDAKGLKGKPGKITDRDVAYCVDAFSNGLNIKNLETTMSGESQSLHISGLQFTNKAFDSISFDDDKHDANFKIIKDLVDDITKSYDVTNASDRDVLTDLNFSYDLYLDKKSSYLNGSMNYVASRNTVSKELPGKNVLRFGMTQSTIPYTKKEVTALTAKQIYDLMGTFLHITNGAEASIKAMSKLQKSLTANAKIVKSLEQAVKGMKDKDRKTQLKRGIEWLRLIANAEVSIIRNAGAGSSVRILKDANIAVQAAGESLRVINPGN